MLKKEKSEYSCSSRISIGTFLVVQWVRFRAPNAGGLGSIPGQGTRFCIPQLKIPSATTKTHHSQIVGASGRTWTQETSVETAKTDQQRTKGSDLEQWQ